ncbi:MAG: hypothetical protein U5K30_08870 [Acidimicrobiales bacterium]|nr:hypothetical protein [Acidimicrobiales bacterium]
MTAARTDDRPTHTKGFWIGLVLGVPVIAFGLRGLLGTFQGVALASYGQYFVGGALLHDLLIAPAVCAVGWLIARWLPRPAVAPVQAALIASSVVAVVAYPFVRGYGATPGEPSFLPRDYTNSVLLVWAVVWMVALVVVAVRVVSARRR